MSLARARAVQGLRSGLRQSARPTTSSRTFNRTQLVARRYASSGDGHGQQSSSDLPWLLAAGIITPTSCYYLWPKASDDHGHGDHHDVGEDDKSQFEGEGENKFQKDHAKLYEEANEDNEQVSANASKVSGEDDDEEEGGDDSKDGDESKGGDESKDDSEQEDKDDKKEDKDNSDGDDKDKSEGDDKDSSEGDDKDSSEGDDKPQQKGKGGDSKVDGVNFKGKLKPDSDGAQHNVKIESDDKGANKKRLDSGLQKNLGPPSREGERGNDTASKQDGLSNTQTRHSEPIHESNEKSKKADGTPETSKHVGTVDPAKLGSK